MGSASERIQRRDHWAHMSDTADQLEPDAAYHLYLHADEVPVATSALRLLISDEARQGQIRTLAREVLDRLDGAPDENRVLSVPLLEGQMKILHTAVKLLHDDLGHEEHDERAVLWGILEKLPDEHAIRAIELG